MTATEIVILAAAFFVVAPEVMRPTALTLNILVAAITVYRFRRARYFSWGGLWPFLLGSVPLAAFGGAQHLAAGTYYVMLALVLLASAALLVWRVYGTGFQRDDSGLSVNKAAAVPIGAAIGMLSGLTGTGGGIFLSPLILLLGWAGPKTTAGIAAPFILVNSIVALAAGSAGAATLPAELPWLAAAAVAGALVGTWLGLSKFSQRGLITALAVVTLVAAGKLLAMA